MFECEIAEFARAVATSARGRAERAARMRCNGSQSVGARLVECASVARSSRSASTTLAAPCMQPVHANSRRSNACWPAGPTAAAAGGAAASRAVFSALTSR